MMTDEFKNKMERQINRADRRFFADYERAQAEADKNPTIENTERAEKLELWAEILRLLYEAWETSIYYSEPELAKKFPRVKLGREGKERKDPLRIIREATEGLRNYGYPILSKTNFSKKLLSIPPNEEAEKLAALKATQGIGYWFARSDAEIEEYKARARREALKTAKTRLVNKRKEFHNLGVADTSLDAAIAAIDNALMTNVIRLNLEQEGGRERQTGAEEG